MGFWNTLKDVGSVAFAPVTGGASLLGTSEDTRSRIPLVGAITGARSDEQKALLAMQQQVAEEAKRRQGQVQDQRMQALGQQMLAFNPRNQLMAQMFGPQAAFTPEQMAQMSQGPMPATDFIGKYGPDGKLVDPAQDAEQRRRLAEYQAAEQRRRDMINANFQAPGQGPAPIQMPQAQAARRY